MFTVFVKSTSKVSLVSPAADHIRICILLKKLISNFFYEKAMFLRNIDVARFAFGALLELLALLGCDKIFHGGG